MSGGAAAPSQAQAPANVEPVVAATSSEPATDAPRAVPTGAERAEQIRLAKERAEAARAARASGAPVAGNAASATAPAMPAAAEAAATAAAAERRAPCHQRSAPRPSRRPKSGRRRPEQRATAGPLPRWLPKPLPHVRPRALRFALPLLLWHRNAPPLPRSTGHWCGNGDSARENGSSRRDVAHWP